MNLILDLGNTTMKMAVFEDNKISEFNRFSYTEDFVGQLSAQLNNLRELPQAVMVSSVSQYHKQVCDMLKNRSIPYILLDENTRLPFKNGYETPATLGKDRLAGVAGAQALFPDTDCLVIDAGTAITYDYISKSGVYEGGNISPGINTRYRSLHTATANLPLLKTVNNYPLLGKNTPDAIHAGVLNGVVFEIDSYIDVLKKLHPRLQTIITGGDVFFFDKKLKNTIFAESFLVPIGLNYILEFGKFLPDSPK